MDDEQEPGALSRVLADIAGERDAQQRLWGPQEFPDGSGPEYADRADAAKAECAAAAKRGGLTWRHILAEEFFEALAESDPERLRAELVQTAAVAVQWVQSLDRRHGGLPHRTNESTGRTEKLVRDRIPDIIRASGRTPRTRVADPSEHAGLLRAKLSEEVAEYMASGDPSELADILEVVHALAALDGLTPAALERLRAEKATERGGFTQRHVLSLRPERDLPANHECTNDRD
jgi:predicted house-cleaning noncanonical NTP pyrophosphatase (MazG superfamily)